MTDFFPLTLTLDEAKKLHRTLVKQHHPDLGGDEATMAIINMEYDRYQQRKASAVAAPTTLDPTAWWSAVVRSTAASTAAPAAEPAPPPPAAPAAPASPRRSRRASTASTSGPRRATVQIVFNQGDVVVEKISGTPVIFRTLRAGALVDQTTCAPQSWRKVQTVVIDRASRLVP